MEIENNTIVTARKTTTESVTTTIESQTEKGDCKEYRYAFCNKAIFYMHSIESNMSIYCNIKNEHL